MKLPVIGECFDIAKFDGTVIANERWPCFSFSRRTVFFHVHLFVEKQRDLGSLIDVPHNDINYLQTTVTVKFSGAIGTFEVSLSGTIGGHVHLSGN